MKLSTEEKLVLINRLAREAEVPGRWEEWLQESSNILVARVVEIIGGRGLTAYTQPMTDLLLRLLEQPASADKLCRAKEALVQALEGVGNLDPEPYLRGLRHVQLEPVFRGRVEDTAPGLRALCATALARLHWPEAHFALAPLLFDPFVQPRLAAIKALVYLVSDASELLLRMKVLAGDADPEVPQACFLGLLALEPERSHPFVEGYLHGPDVARFEAAALALGESRIEEAFPLLRATWEANSDLDRRKPLLLAMALTRREDAFDYLLTLMREEGGTTALLACDALALYGVDRRYRERMEAAVAATRDRRLIDAYTTHFPPGP